MDDFTGQHLAQLDVVDVFLKKCAAEGYNETDTADLKQTFLELLNE